MEIVNNIQAVNNNQVVNPISLSVTSHATPVAWKGVQGCKSFATPVTIKEAVEAVGADYTVKKEHLVRVPDALIHAIRNGMPYAGLNLTTKDIITSHMATIREDADLTLGVVGANYGVVQNAKAFEFIDIITSGELGGERPVIETAGILDGGARMYVTAKMPNDMYLGGNDRISDYILFTNTHDGSGAVTVLFTPIRVVCQNTLNAALRTAKNKLIFKHTSRVGERLDWERKENVERAVAVLKMHETFKEEFIKNLYVLADKKLESDLDALKFASEIYTTPAQMKLLKQANFMLDNVEEISTRSKNQITALRNTIESGIGQDMYRGTKLWLFNGLTSFISNERKFKTTEDKLDSILGGDAYKKVQKGFDILAA